MSLLNSRLPFILRDRTGMDDDRPIHLAEMLVEAGQVPLLSIRPMEDEFMGMQPVEATFLTSDGPQSSYEKMVDESDYHETLAMLFDNIGNVNAFGFDALDIPTGYPTFLLGEPGSAEHYDVALGVPDCTADLGNMADTIVEHMRGAAQRRRASLRRIGSVVVTNTRAVGTVPTLSICSHLAFNTDASIVRVLDTMDESDEGVVQCYDGVSDIPVEFRVKMSGKSFASVLDESIVLADRPLILPHASGGRSNVPVVLLGEGRHAGPGVYFDYAVPAPENEEGFDDAVRSIAAIAGLPLANGVIV